MISTAAQGLLERLDDRTRLRLVHWGRAALALLAGAGAALVHPPFGFLPGLLGYPLLMFLAERSQTARGGFWMGWLAGFSYFLIGCWWVAEAFLVNPAQAWMAPFAASLLPAGMGLFWGAAGWLHRRLGAEGPWRFLVFAALFGLFEWLRGHVLTGFPWNPAGAGWAAGSPASQFAATVGVYGLGLVTVAAVSTVGVLIGPGRRRVRLGAVLAGVAVLAALNIGGAMRLGQARLTPSGTVVRLVQPDVSQESKWSPEAYVDIVQRYLNLTASPGAAIPDVILWPEGALPARADEILTPDAPEAQALSRALLPGQVLLAGLSRAEPDPQAHTGARYYNSLFVLGMEGGRVRVSDVYDKHRLVPFGEFLPLGGLMGALGIRSLVHVPADFSAGPAPAPLSLPGGRPSVQPLICYESLYPGFTPGGADRPRWIANVSNDAWFGRSSGPLQHLNLASYRAIETGLPVARTTPTGVSALIDPWGRIVPGARMEQGESGVIDAQLPEPAAPTLYSRWGDLPFALALAGFLLPVLRRRTRRSQPMSHTDDKTDRLD